MSNFDIYKKYFIDKQFEREELFLKLVEKYQIKSILYPGSFVHITPSFSIPKAYYVDSDGQAKKFFAKKDEVMALVAKRKNYTQEPELSFFGQDYFKPIDIEAGSVDLLVSQYAGPISQACKKYLRKGGHLLVNNSHADAGIAALDKDYKLVGAVNLVNGKYGISENKLDTYFHPKKEGMSLYKRNHKK